MKLKFVWLTIVLSTSAIAIAGTLWHANLSGMAGRQVAPTSFEANAVSAEASKMPIQGTQTEFETKTKLVNYTVMKPVYESHQKEITYTVLKPVYETKEKTVRYTVCRMVPETKTKTVNYTTCRMVPEARQKTIEYKVARTVLSEDQQTESK